MHEHQTDVLILGAGWSGLVAADMLAGDRQKVVLIEKEAGIGGLARTFRAENFQFDVGGHGLHFKRKENLAYLFRLVDAPELQIQKRRARVYFQRRYLSYPPGLLSLFQINKEDLLKIILETFRKKRERRLENFEEWVRYHYGDHLFGIYFNDYTQKVWGQPCHVLSSAWAQKRIGQNKFWGMIGNLLTVRGEVKDTERHFLYPRRGIGHLVDAMERRLVGRCSIVCRASPVSFERSGRQLVALHYSANGRIQRIRFKKVLSTIPLRELSLCMPKDCLRLFSEMAGTIRYRSLVLVVLIVGRRAITDWHWCYYPDKEIIFSRVHEPKRWSGFLVSEKGRTLLCAEIFCDYDDPYWRMDEGDLFARVKDSFLKTGLLSVDDAVSGLRVERVRYAYPLHVCGSEETLDQLRDAFAFFQNLRLAGRNGTHSYFDMEECLDSVRQSVKFF